MKSPSFNFSSILAIVLALAIIEVPSSYGMIKALHTAATGMAAQETNVNTISHNISNLGTTAFKRSRTEFDDLLYVTYEEPGARSSARTLYNVGVQIGSGSRVTAVRKEFFQGSPKVTQNPFDFMIKGEGFFGVILPNGESAYTRNGALNLDEQGALVTDKGHRLYPGFIFPPNTSNVNVAQDGVVEAFIRGNTTPLNLGRIPIFTFINQVGLKSMGGNLYRPTRSSGEAIENLPGVAGASLIEQGTLESSNVSIMTEMTGLITAQRAYEMNSKVMKVVDEMLGSVNSIR